MNNKQRAAYHENTIFAGVNAFKMLSESNQVTAQGDTLKVFVGGIRIIKDEHMQADSFCTEDPKLAEILKQMEGVNAEK